MMPEQRLAELRLELPPAPKPVAVYKPLVIVGNMAYVSGHGPLRADKTLITGVVGRDLDLDEGRPPRARSASPFLPRSDRNSAAWIACAASSKCSAW